MGDDFYDDENNYGDEDQNDLMEMIRTHKEEISSMEIREKIDQLNEEIKGYKTAQRDAGDALNSAEMELDEILDEEYRNTNKE